MYSEAWHPSLEGGGELKIQVFLLHLSVGPEDQSSWYDSRAFVQLQLRHAGEKGDGTTRWRLWGLAWTVPGRPELGHLGAASLRGPEWRRQADNSLRQVLVFLQPVRKIRDKSAEGVLEPWIIAASQHYGLLGEVQGYLHGAPIHSAML